jgi:hypothetical protein
MRWVRLQNGIVVEITTSAGSPGAAWVASETAQLGWTYNGSAFTGLPAAPVPSAVDGFQFREQLRVQGIYDAALAAVTAAGGRTLRAFNEASVFGRGNPSFNALADALGYTEAQKDQFFRDAAAIRA